MNIRSLWFASGSLLAICGHAFAQDYLGAEAILAKAQAASAAGKKEEGEPKDSAKKIAADLKLFSSASGLSPDDAAKQWLALLQRTFSLSPLVQRGYGDMEYFQQLNFSAFVTALPGPASWAPLSDAIALQDPKAKGGALSKPALQWFVHRLQGDIPALQEDYEILQKFPDSLPPEMAGAGNGLLAPIEKAMFDVSDDGATILKILDRNLDRAIQPPKPHALNFSGGNEKAPFEIPDLAGLVGVEKASTFLKKALLGLPGPLVISHGYDTRKLASKLALEHVAKLKSAQWGLTLSLEGGPLYSAMLAKFGAPTARESEFSEAQQYELLRLLIAGKTKEAIALSKKMTGVRSDALPSNAIEQIENSGKSAIVSDFFHGLLSQNPNLPYWDDYIKVSVHAGSSDQMMALLRTSLDRQDLSPETREDLEKRYADAFLATGKVDEGVAELLKAAAAPPKVPASGSSSIGGSVRHIRARSSTDSFGAAEHIARLGFLLNRPEWIDQGLTLAREALKAESEPSNHTENAKSLAALLLDLGRGPEAEAVLADALVQASAPQDSSFNQGFNLSDNASEILCALIGLYTAADRSADVLALLEQSPQWMATDLSQILDKSCYLGKRHTESVGGCTAQALLKTGQKEKARSIVLAILDQDANDDRIYELLLSVDKAGAIPILDRLAARDPFEERPLIWKAKLLFDAGQLDEAEKTARQAIKIDPSDGETGPGDRMRVYSVLADILEAKGNAADSKIFRGVVQAIRLSEDADVYYEEGLVSQAIAMYEKSLVYFADAYCIQSRLALRMLELGDWKGAEDHYRHAYELMPDSFGRVESHCFGCERAFAGEKQQTIAERVFTKIAAERPDNPQVHYLLGYLRYEQERYSEALPEFQRAVELDPDYLNAWKKIEAVSEEVHLPAALRNNVATNLLRLDSARRHSTPDLSGVTDLAAVWMFLEQRSAQAPSSSKDIFPLKASAEAVAAMAADTTNPARAQAFQSAMAMARYREARSERTPGAVFATQSFSNAVQMLIQTAQYLNLNR
ncbi:hypothetical protein BH09VER1_BH09VER1_02090 [soil metagenome]